MKIITDTDDRDTTTTTAAAATTARFVKRNKSRKNTNRSALIALSLKRPMWSDQTQINLVQI